MLTQKRLKQLLHYNPETGIFTRLTSNRKQKTGDIAGGLNTIGYWTIHVDNARRYAHRLAWLYVHGAWPNGDIDHINGNRADCKISNLRDVPHKINMQNSTKPRSNNKTGFLGVHWSGTRNKFIAKIKTDNKSKHIGCFDTSEEAYAAYVSEKRICHPGGCL
jgi:hypothetical protein